MCSRDSLLSPQLLYWADRMRPAWDEAGSGAPVLMHRKMWEWLFITESLSQAGMLQPGKKGLGFGVGQEPLAAFFASMGCSIVATDMAPDRARSAGWTSDGQHTSNADQLNRHGLCDPEDFRSRVGFRVVDMNDIPRDLRGFDFTWSACAFEHLGTLEHGRKYVIGQMRCLRRGGISVHTTELNVTSNDKTIDDFVTVLYREKDIEKLARSLGRRGHKIQLDFTRGTSVEDEHVDVPPFSNVHLKTVVGDYVTTSYGIVILKRKW